MKLRETTREVIQLVEKLSGIPAQVTEDPNLQTLANVQMAREGGLPQHLIVYKPESGQEPDYQICFQCGYIIRTFQNPPDERFDMTETSKGREDVESLIRQPGGLADKFRLRKSKILEMRDQYLSGLLIHLRSVPIGLRISEWLSENYPELDNLQREHVEKELAINKQSLSAKIKMLTPEEVYEPSLAISAAYALYWANKYNRQEYFNPYRLEGFQLTAHELIDIYHEIPDDPINDYKLIEEWGKHLNIDDWFEFIPYKSGKKIT